MELINNALSAVSNALFGTILVWLLIGAGIYFTVRTRAVQIRHARPIFNAVSGSREGSQGGITSFQAFAIGLACRVGTGNIVGVALALVLGGPGAIFWMWMVAIVGTSTAFMESTLAQIFKVRQADGTFRGGPAFYISRGLKTPIVGAIFAVVFLLANGLAMPMVQSNAINESLMHSAGSAPWVGALFVVALSAPVLLGGLRRIARVTEVLAPMMALAYLVLVLVIVAMHPAQTVDALGDIFAGAFGLRAGLGGIAGGITQSILNGVRRGLFSNEAGLGGAASAAGSATLPHPVLQGFIQAFGVVVDTIFICTATALAILVAGADVYTPGVTAKEAAGTLTQQAVAASLGDWTAWPMTILIVVLAYSTIIGAFSYAQVNLDFLTDKPWLSKALQLGAVVCAGIGAFQELTTVWTLADVLLGIGAVINLIALLLLGKWVYGALRDWEAQRESSAPLQFRSDSEYLPAPVPTDSWPST